MTYRSRSLQVVAVISLWSAPALAEPIAETELVRAFLHAPVAQSELDAVRADTLAASTGTSLLMSPTVGARREEARGSAGATTNAIGAAVTVDLGLSALGDTRAAQLRAMAGEYNAQAAALGAVCELRAEALDLWAANASGVVSESAHQRLDDLLATLAVLAEAGEVSGYALDRATLASSAHAVSAAERRGDAQILRAHVSAMIDTPITDVQLLDTPPLPPLNDALDQSANHPGLVALQQRRDAEATATRAARWAQLPDLTLAGGPRWDAPPDGGIATPGYEIGGSIQLPWTDGSRAHARQTAAALAHVDAQLTRFRAQLHASVRSAHARVTDLAQSESSDTSPDAVWESAMDLYTAGELPLGELLQTAEAVEDASLATIAQERLQRRAHLDLSCATGQFANPAVQSLLQETLQ
ncbi:MAG: hypothetical protein ACJATT_001805 [Myxococcota bacterium]|jgi:hypothetical protein